MTQLQYSRTGDLQSAIKQLLANLAGSGSSGTGADAIGYTPSGTGAVATTAAAKFDLHVDVANFGAVPNTGTDQATAVQAAIDAISASGIGGVVDFSYGDYTLSKITLKKRVWLRGSGKGTRLVSIAANTNAAMIQYDSGAFWTTISDLCVEGNAASNVGHVTAGIHLGNIAGQNHTVRDCQITNWTGDGLVCDNGSNFFGPNLWVLTCAGYGLNMNYLGGGVGATDNFIHGVHVGQCGLSGIRLAYANNRVWGCKSFENGTVDSVNHGDGIEILWGASKVDIDCQGNGRYGVYISNGSPVDSAYSSGIDVSFITDGSNGTVGLPTPSLAGLGIDGNNCSNARVRGVVFIGEGQAKYILDWKTTGGSGNDIEISFDPSAFTTSPVHNSPAGYQRVRLGMRAEAISLATAGAITPDPYAYEWMNFGALTGNITAVNVTTQPPYPGQEMTLSFLQGAGGGSTVGGWNAVYKIGGFTVDGGANKTSTIKFKYNGLTSKWEAQSYVSGV